MAKKTAHAPSGQKAPSVTIHDQKLERGAGGELHQFAEGGTPVLTTAHGGPVADDQNSLRVGFAECHATFQIIQHLDQ